MIYWFELWREYRLSLAEIYTFFPKAQKVYIDQKIALFENISEVDIQEFCRKCGGSIKVFMVIEYLKKPQLSEVVTRCYTHLEELGKQWKLKYALNVYGTRCPPLKSLLPSLKKKLKDADISSRFVNQNFQNAISASVLWEKLVSTQSDINLIFVQEGIYFWVTLWVQDINAYTKRDFGKKRDMQVGMLPPKLAQIMINLSAGNKRNIKVYDPFCGLGTVLIESVLMGNTEVYGSDINSDMVLVTQQNLDFLEENFWLQHTHSAVMLQDAKKVWQWEIIRDMKIDVIVTEWYLGEIFTQGDISFEKVKHEKHKLIQLYDEFFQSLKKSGWKGTIVMCLPFWDIRWKFVYMNEVYDIITKNGTVLDILPKNDFVSPTRSWSLLYKRSNQLVWREIFKLRMK